MPARYYFTLLHLLNQTLTPSPQLTSALTPLLVSREAHHESGASAFSCCRASRSRHVHVDSGLDGAISDSFGDTSPLGCNSHS